MLLHRIDPFKEVWARPVQQHRQYHGEGGYTTPEEWDRMYGRSPRFEIPIHESETIVVPTVEGKTSLHLVNAHSSKLVYTTWLIQLPFKRGDYCVASISRPPYFQQQVARVVGLQEVQGLCKYDHKERPMCLDLITSGGTRFMAAPKMWHVVEVPEELHFDLPAPGY